MDFEDLERAFGTCLVEADDIEDDVARKRERRRRVEADLLGLLQRQEPTADQAYALAKILSSAGPGDPSPLELAERLARLAHAEGHPEAGRLVARCVDRLLVQQRKPQRYATLCPVVAGERRLLPVDPSVKDEERAALGLPPLAQVVDEIANGNRAAACRVAEEGLPDGVNLRRVLRSFSPSDIDRALDGRGEAVWPEGEDLVFCWRGAAQAVTAWFGIEMAMDHVEGTDLWVLAVRIRDLDRAAFSYRFLPRRADGTTAPWEAPAGTWRGLAAPPLPERSSPLEGELRTIPFTSEALGERRDLHVYLPPGHDRRRPSPVVYATDSRTSADLIEPLVISGRVPPVIAVGVPFGSDLDGDRRAQEYIPGHHAERFEAHRRFFVDELSAWAEAELGAASEPQSRAVFGVSNGAAFAAAMGVRHPEHFGVVIAFSLGIVPRRPQWESGRAPRHYLCAGTLEEGFFRGTQQWAQVASAAGSEVFLRSWVSGHDMVMWDGELPAAIEWAFGKGEGLKLEHPLPGPAGRLLF